MGKSGIVKTMKKNIVMPSQKAVKGVYDVRAYYSSNPIIKYIFRKRIELALKLCGDCKNKKVLDGGCGAGFLSLNLAIRGAEVFAIDLYTGLNYTEKIMRAMIKNEINFNKADLTNLPYKSNSFDVVFALDVLEHLWVPEQALFEIKRVLKANGSLIVSIPNENIFYALGQKIAAFKKHGPGHKHSASELIDLISKNFEEVGSRSVPSLFNVFLIKKFVNMK